MNTATLDLIMAGNEQYRSRSFHAAEIGVERALWNNNAFVSSKNFPLTDVTTTGSGNDGYQYEVKRPDDGVLETPPDRTSVGTYKAIYFRINVTGTSERGARTVVEQELYEVAQDPTTFSCVAGVGACTL
jgi:hypothetical protein